MNFSNTIVKSVINDYELSSRMLYNGIPFCKLKDLKKTKYKFFSVNYLKKDNMFYIGFLVSTNWSDSVIAFYACSESEFSKIRSIDGEPYTSVEQYLNSFDLQLAFEAYSNTQARNRA